MTICQVDIDGCELINTYRTFKYLQKRGVAVSMSCDSIMLTHSLSTDPRLIETFGDTPDQPGYEAPWVTDEVLPSAAAWASHGAASFLGFDVINSSSLYGTHLERVVNNRATGGASLSRLRARGREISYDLRLFYTTAEGLAYGLRWLEDTLGGCGPCGGQEMTVRDVVSPLPQPFDSVSNPSVGLAPAAWWDTGRWTFKNSGLVKWSDTGQTYAFGHGVCATDITITMGVGDPCRYGAWTDGPKLSFQTQALNCNVYDSLTGEQMVIGGVPAVIPASSYPAPAVTVGNAMFLIPDPGPLGINSVELTITVTAGSTSRLIVETAVDAYGLGPSAGLDWQQNVVLESLDPGRYVVSGPDKTVYAETAATPNSTVVMSDCATDGKLVNSPRLIVACLGAACWPMATCDKTWIRVRQYNGLCAQGFVTASVRWRRIEGCARCS